MRDFGGTRHFNEEMPDPEPLPDFADHESSCRRKCCDEATCPRAEISRQLAPEASDEVRVDLAAAAIAATCGTLSNDDLELCFRGMFELSPECRLFDRFRAVYQTERDSIDGQQLISKFHAAGDGI